MNKEYSDMWYDAERRHREWAAEREAMQAAKKLSAVLNLRSHLRAFISDESEVQHAAEYLYNMGYRRVGE